jgi:peptidylprolyl isomerase
MDLKKISGAAFFAVAIVACLALMSTHNQAEDIKYYGEDLGSIGGGVYSEDAGTPDTSVTDSLFNDNFDDEPSNDDGADKLSGLSALEPDSDDSEDDVQESSSDDTQEASKVDPLAEFEESINSSDEPQQAGGGDDSLQDGDQVTVQYKLRKSDGSEVYRQWGDGDGGEFTFELGGGHVIPGFDQAVSTMSVGDEQDDVQIPADQAYGSKGFEAMGIGPNEDLTYDLKVVSKN